MTTLTTSSLDLTSGDDEAHSAELTEQLTDLLDLFDVPGAAFAFAHGDQVAHGAAGVLSRFTGYPATPDSWFQIGSITKLFTATLVMQLVDEGLVELDSPVRRYLPRFDTGNDAASASITVRHLMTHSSGLRGDYIGDFGRGTDAVRRHVASLPQIGMLHRPGAWASYCNSGFIVLGELLETLRGTDYHTVLTERLLKPLGIRGGTTAEEAMLHRAAVGHVDDPEGGAAVPAPSWAMPFSAGPAGSTPFMDAASLLAFARMHLDGGLAPDGERLLSEWAVSEMQRPQAVLPNIDHMDSIGASWIRYRWDGAGTGAQGPLPDGTLILGHDGGTWGQYSYLRMHPATRSMVVLMTNGPGGGRLFEAFGAPLLAEAAGLPAPRSPRPPARQIPLDTRQLAGRYRHYDLDVVVMPQDNGISIELHSLETPDKMETAELVPHSTTDAGVFLVTSQPFHGNFQAVMFPTAGTSPDFLMFGSRMFTRQPSAAQ